MKVRLAAALAVLAFPAAAHADTLTVTTDADTGAGSLRDAVSKAHDGDTIEVGARHIVLTTGAIDFVDLSGVTVHGAGPGQTSVSGNHVSRVFVGNKDLILRDLTVQDGQVTGTGGAVMIKGLTTSDVVFSGNHSTSTGGAVATKTLPVTIDRTLFTDNHSNSDGGAIVFDNNGTADITNTTFADNHAGETGLGGGGGLVALNASTVTITLVNDTFANNTASSGAGPAFRLNGNTDTLHYRNTAFVGNGDTCGQLSSPQIVSDGHNAFDGTPAASCHTATADTIVADAKLGPLADNGGPFMTLLPGDGSPLLGAADTCPAVDARGFSRPTPGACDAGAVERSAPDAVTLPLTGSPSTLTNLSGTYDGHDRLPTTYFEWGTSTAYGSTTPATAQPTSSGTATATITTTVPGTTYHYRFVVVTSDGTAMGADQQFSTATVPHAVVHCTVPAVRKRKRAAAKAKTLAKHCTPHIKRAFSKTIHKGRVIKAVPGHGTILAENATVTLVVSKGKKPHHKKQRH